MRDTQPRFILPSSPFPAAIVVVASTEHQKLSHPHDVLDLTAVQIQSFLIVQFFEKLFPCILVLHSIDNVGPDLVTRNNGKGLVLDSHLNARLECDIHSFKAISGHEKYSVEALDCSKEFWFE
jgi:hypothetical protein